MKIITTLLVSIFCFTTNGFGQNPWLNSTPIKLGFANQTWKVNDLYQGFRYEQIDNVPNNSGPLTLAESNKVSFNRMQMTFENIGEHFHQETCITGVWDLLWETIGGTKTFYEGGPEALRFEMFRFRMGGGGWIDNKIGLFGGAQYAYSTMRLKDPSVPDEMISGGNQRGFHGMMLLNLDRLLVKTTAMYDWVAISKKAQKGNAFTLDLQGYYGLTENRAFGVYTNLSFKNMSQSGPSGTPTEDWRNKGVQNQGVENFTYQFPDLKTNITQVSLGFYAFMYGGK